MIHIQIKDLETPEIIEFVKKEWEIADMHYYGKKLDGKKKTRFIQAFENNELLGSLELDFLAGVMHILDLIVDHAHQKQGVGEMLLKKAEEIAKKENLHKIFLETGKTWEVRKFYEKRGYIKTGDLPNHYGGQDFVEYSKFL